MEHEAREFVVGSAHCWVLRRHPVVVGCCSLAAPGLGRLTHPGGFVLLGVVVVVVGWGVVVC